MEGGNIYRDATIGKTRPRLYLEFPADPQDSETNGSFQGRFSAHIREQMFGPDLHVFTIKFLVQKTPGFFHFFRVKIFLLLFL